MLELLFVIGFFVMLLVTGVSILGILAAIVVAVAAVSHCGRVGDSVDKYAKNDRLPQ